MHSEKLSPTRILKAFAAKSALRKKVLIRLLPYSILFAIIIMYSFFANSELLFHSNELAQMSKQAVQSSGPEVKTVISKEIAAASEEIRASSESFRTFIILMGGAITLLLICEFLFAGRGINNMDKVANFANTIAGGDLTVNDVEISGHRDLRQVATALNNMKHRLSDVVSNVSATVHNLSGVSDNLLNSSKTITDDTDRQIASTRQVAGAVEMMSIVVHDVTRNSSNAATSVREASSLATDGGAIVSQTINGMMKISDSVSRSAETITVLGERSDQIGEIVKVINDIASQTNLLALNAAIEAARAGDQGRGFAVVADEVRKLAERTTSATNEIEDMIRSIQSETRHAVESMETATKEVEEGVTLASQADESLNQIMSSVQSVMNMVQQIADSAKQQSTTGEEVTENLQSIADENQKTAEAARQYYATTMELNSLSHKLDSMISDLRCSDA